MATRLAVWYRLWFLYNSVPLLPLPHQDDTNLEGDMVYLSGLPKSGVRVLKEVKFPVFVGL